MRLKNNHILLAILLLAGTLPLVAQESSPYSRFGLGNIQDNNTVHISGMGGIGTSYRNTESFSLTNPASLSALKLTGFEFALNGSYSKLKSTEGSTPSFNANMSYMALSLPIKKFWVASAGLVPYSVKDYRINDTLTTSDNLNTSRVYEGGGGTYNAYFANGFQYKDFSVGVNVGYMFGRLENYVLATPLDSTNSLDPGAYSSLRENFLRVRGLTWNVGAQYEIPVSDKIDLIVGASGNISTKLSDRNELQSGFYTVPNDYVGRFKTDNENLSDFLELLSGAGVDTLKFTSENISVKLPSAINAGLTLIKGSDWQAGVDFRYQLWSKYENFETTSNTKYSNSWRVAIGGEWRPKSTSESSKFLQRIKYRGGFYAQRTNLELKGRNIDEYGLSLGFGLPLLTALSDDNGFIQRYMLYPFNLAFEMGTRGTTSEGLVRDNFFRIKFGLTLSDKWFVKRKYL
jgi:long-subunit fatty acid transport protein